MRKSYGMVQNTKYYNNDVKTALHTLLLRLRRSRWEVPEALLPSHQRPAFFYESTWWVFDKMKKMNLIGSIGYLTG